MEKTSDYRFIQIILLAFVGFVLVIAIAVLSGANVRSVPPIVFLFYSMTLATNIFYLMQGRSFIRTASLLFCTLVVQTFLVIRFMATL